MAENIVSNSLRSLTVLERSGKITAALATIDWSKSPEDDCMIAEVCDEVRKQRRFAPPRSNVELLCNASAFVLTPRFTTRSSRDVMT